MALHRFYQKSPSSVSHLLSNFRKRLCDNDPGVMGASLCPLFDIVAASPDSFKDLSASFVNILKQVAEHRLPKSYDYHRTPAPFIQIKLLKILALLGAGDKQTSENMYTVLGDIFRKGDSTSNIGNAILYECICTVTSIYPNAKLLEEAGRVTSRFLKSDSHNLKYMGIDALCQVIRINPDFVEEHQLAVIDCLQDPDDTLKRKTLDLLYKMTKSSNVEVIVEHMINYMINVNDSHYKTEIASRCIELAERFAPSNHWFIQTMNKVFEHAGDLVNIKAAHNLMRLIAEGSGEDNEDADSQLRASAVDSYLQILEEPKLPSIFLQVICWVLGEYGTANGKYSAQHIIGKLCDLADAHSEDDIVKGYAVTAIMKIFAFEISSGRKVNMLPECQSLIDELSASHSTDLQQRVYELQALLGLGAETVENVMPLDASCEDIELDQNLSFLNDYVQSALEKGASPYIPESKRFEEGNLSNYVSRHDQGEGTGSSLKFEAYEYPTIPVAPKVQATSSIVSPTDSGFSKTGHVSFALSEGPPSTNDGIKLQLDGVQKKWGRPSYTSSYAVSSVTAKSDVSNNGTHQGLSSHIKEASYDSRQMDRRNQSELSTEKQRLAASLFGSSSSTTDKKTLGSNSAKSIDRRSDRSHHGTRPATASNKVDGSHQIVAAPPPVADLLDLSDEVPATDATTDPFKQLESLLEPSKDTASPKPTPSQATSPKPTPSHATTSSVDLMSLDGGQPLPAVSPVTSESSSGQTPLTALFDDTHPESIQNKLSSSTCPMGEGNAGQSVTAVKKGLSSQDSLHKDAVARQVGVTPTGKNPNLFKDLLDL
eukprot:TRINITY_DN4243_c0_g2_i1.p1 TRINITY_DN4243_c0_g2~~TRINITY_DN4243_c0_g2_i1.p1  ORF type:complete len:923 (+),score=193.52 TRINITY_DN4243_c0_g2_i1:295-2769(+)